MNVNSDSSKPEKFTFSYLNLLSFCLFILSLYFYYHLYPNEIIFNSDTLYFPSLVKDLFIQNGNLSDWSLTPAPYFFPDLFVFSGIFFLTDFDPILSLVIYGILQITIFVIFGFRIWKKVFRDLGVRSHSSGIVFCILSFIFFLGPLFPSFYLISLPTMHGSAVLGSIYLIGSYSDPQKIRLSKWDYLVVFPFFVGLVASDRLVLVTGFLPILIQTLIWEQKNKPFRKIALFLGSIGFLGYLTYLILQSYFMIPSPSRISSGHSALLYFREFLVLYNSLGSELNLSDFISNSEKTGRSLSLIFLLTSLGFILYANRKSNEEKDLFSRRQIQIWSLFLLLNLWVPILGGYYFDLYSQRYSIGFYMVLPFFAAAVFLSESLRKSADARLPFFFLGFVFGFFLLLIGVLLQKGSNIQNSVLENKKGSLVQVFSTPPKVRCYLRIMDQEKIDFLIADFWNAKVLYVLGSENLTSIHLDYQTLNFSTEVTNTEWGRRIPGQNIGLIPERMDKKRLAEKYGAPVDIKKCGKKHSDREVWVYPNQNADFIQSALRGKPEN